MNSPRLSHRSHALAIIIGALFVFIVPSASAAPLEHLEDKPGALPTSPELERFFATSRVVERALRKGEPRYTLEVKKSHPYPKVLEKGEPIGRFRPETGETSIRAEITTFNIGRALGCGELFQPAAPVTLRGHGLKAFRKQLEASAMPEHKVEERRMLLQALADDPLEMLGAYKPMVPAGALKYTGIERIDEPPNGGLETNDVIAKYLRHDSPQPSRELVPLPGVGGRGSAAALARQLSDILLVDVLAGQWDRFSGHNLHVIPSPEGAHFMAIDNGGADPANDQGYLEKFTHWVTRFDPPVVEHLTALDNFLRKRGKFREFDSEQDLAIALGFASSTGHDWKAFKERVHRVTNHVRAMRSGGMFER